VERAQIEADLAQRRFMLVDRKRRSNLSITHKTSGARNPIRRP
jgi:hypothetical protein